MGRLPRLMCRSSLLCLMCEVKSSPPHFPKCHHGGAASLRSAPSPKYRYYGGEALLCSISKISLWCSSFLSISKISLWCIPRRSISKYHCDAALLRLYYSRSISKIWWYSSTSSLVRLVHSDSRCLILSLWLHHISSFAPMIKVGPSF